MIKRIKKALARILKERKILIHPLAPTAPSAMKRYIGYINKLLTVKPENIFEIGANFGQDSEYMRIYLELPPSAVYIFEPHPEIVKEVKKIYKFNIFDFAVSNKDGKAIFYAADLKNSGISSLYQHSLVKKESFREINIKTVRMDSFMNEFNVEDIDFLKIDVEGTSFEVLEGFGSKLRRVKSLQLEAEHIEVWKGQKLFDDIYPLLVCNGFQLVFFELLDGKQSDSFWIQKDYLKRF